MLSAAVVATLSLIGGCGCAPAPPPNTTVYFVEQLYDGNVLLPGMRDDGNWTAKATPGVRPAGIKFGSGEMWRVDRWTGWGTARAVGAGSYGNHGTRVRGNVVLTQPKKCAGRWMYTQLEANYTERVPSNLRPYVPTVVRITTC